MRTILTVLAFLTTWSALDPLLAQHKLHVPLVFSDAEGRALTDEPVALGIPISRYARLRDLGGLAVDGADQSQFHVLERWPDGTVRWLLLRTRIDLEAGRRNTAHYLKSDQRRPASAPLAKEVGTAIEIETGTISLRIDSNGTLTADDWRAQFEVPINGVTLEENGPIATVVRCSFAGGSARWTLHRDKSHGELHVAWSNDAETELGLRIEAGEQLSTLTLAPQRALQGGLRLAEYRVGLPPTTASLQPIPEVMGRVASPRVYNLAGVLLSYLLPRRTVQADQLSSFESLLRGFLSIVRQDSIVLWQRLRTSLSTEPIGSVSYRLYTNLTGDERLREHALAQAEPSAAPSESILWWIGRYQLSGNETDRTRIWEMVGPDVGDISPLALQALLAFAEPETLDRDRILDAIALATGRTPLPPRLWALGILATGDSRLLEAAAEHLAQERTELDPALDTLEHIVRYTSRHRVWRELPLEVGSKGDERSIGWTVPPRAEAIRMFLESEAGRRQVGALPKLAPEGTQQEHSIPKTGGSVVAYYLERGAALPTPVPLSPHDRVGARFVRPPSEEVPSSVPEESAVSGASQTAQNVPAADSATAPPKTVKSSEEGKKRRPTRPSWPFWAGGVLVVTAILTALARKSR